jgi:hypothetical protein
MPRMIGISILVAVAFVAAQPTVASAQALTLHVQESCQPPRGPESPGFMARLSGLPPNASFTGGIDYTETRSGQRWVATYEFTASSEGTYEVTDSIWFTVPIDRLTVFATYNGQRVEQTLYRLCQGPYTKDDCKNGGWKTYGVFKNQRECVRFARQKARQSCDFERAEIGRAAFIGNYGQGRHKRQAMRGCIRQRVNG